MGLITVKRQLNLFCNGFIKAMSTHSKDFSSGCLFMATVFAFTSIYKSHIKVDKEFSLWMPLHAGAAILSCYHAFRVSRWSRVAAYGLLVGSAAVFLKEMSGYVVKGHFDWHASTSLDMHKHDVREKIGSFLVLLAMGLQLDAFGGLFQSTKSMMIVTASSALCAACLIQASSLGAKEDLPNTGKERPPASFL